jgi:HSP20 family protein
MERRWNRFERSFTLPAAVNENSVRASLDNGLLTVTLDKREEVKPRKIQITAGPKANTQNTTVGQNTTIGTPNVGAPETP